MRRIIFSQRSKNQLDSLIKYLELEFSILSRAKFVKNFDEIILIIQKNPDTFRVSEINGNIRKCVISKQTSLYYRFNNYEIRLLSLFDTRQNPTKITQIK